MTHNTTETSDTDESNAHSQQPQSVEDKWRDILESHVDDEARADHLVNVGFSDWRLTRAEPPQEAIVPIVKQRLDGSDLNQFVNDPDTVQEALLTELEAALNGEYTGPKCLRPELAEATVQLSNGEGGSGTVATTQSASTETRANAQVEAEESGDSDETDSRTGMDHPNAPSGDVRTQVRDEPAGEAADAQPSPGETRTEDNSGPSPAQANDAGSGAGAAGVFGMLGVNQGGPPTPGGTDDQSAGEQGAAGSSAGTGSRSTDATRELDVDRLATIRAMENNRGLIDQVLSQAISDAVDETAIDIDQLDLDPEASKALVEAIGRISEEAVRRYRQRAQQALLPEQSDKESALATALAYDWLIDKRVRRSFEEDLQE